MWLFLVVIWAAYTRDVTPDFDLGSKYNSLFVSTGEGMMSRYLLILIMFLMSEGTVFSMYSEDVLAASLKKMVQHIQECNNKSMCGMPLRKELDKFIELKEHVELYSLLRIDIRIWGNYCDFLFGKLKEICDGNNVLREQARLFIARKFKEYHSKEHPY